MKQQLSKFIFIFFYYQNVLELAVCDEDPLTKDDMQFTVLFNVARVRPGERVRETFALKSEVRTENTWTDLTFHFGFCVR